MAIRLVKDENYLPSFFSSSLDPLLTVERRIDRVAKRHLAREKNTSSFGRRSAFAKSHPNLFLPPSLLSLHPLLS